MVKYDVGQRVVCIEVVNLEPIRAQSNLVIVKITKKHIYVVSELGGKVKFDLNGTLDGVDEDYYHYILPQVN